MRTFSTYLLPLFLFILIVSGCSSDSTNPVTTETSGNDPTLLVPDIDLSKTNRSLLGLWTVGFDVESLTATVLSERALNVHWNVTGLIPTPIIVVNHYDPSTQLVNVDVTLSNPTAAAAWDIRLIIFTDDVGHMLINGDNWTPLYDIAGGNYINPFKAYAKDNPDRMFDAQSQHTENLSIYLPGGNPEVTFAVDASVVENCEEPYVIENFRSGYLCSEYLSSTLLEIDVFDWQEDTSAVYLNCPEITGEQLTPFTNVDPVNFIERWILDLVNETSAPAGEYTAVIMANSENSGLLALYDIVTIEIIDCEGIPYNPQLIASFKYLSDCEDVVVKDDYAYVADKIEGLIVVDISDPDNPVVVNIFHLYRAMSITNEGNYIYVAGDDLSIFDIQNPESPYLESTTEFGGTPNDIEIVDGYAYIASHSRGLIIIDVTLPSAPINTGEVDFNGIPKGVAVNGDYAYMAAGEYFAIVNVSDPYNPLLVESFWKGDTNKGYDLVFEGSHAFMASAIYQGSSSPGGVKTYSFSNPEDLERIGGIETIGNAYDIVIQGIYAYIADGEAGLTIVDISNPVSLAVVGNVETSYASRVFVDGNLAYVLDDRRAVRIIDVSDPYHPSIIGHVLRTEALDVEINDGTAFVAAGDGGFISVDISDPNNPHLMDALCFPRTKVVAIDDNYAYIADGTQDWYFYMVDIGNPYNLQVIGATKLSSMGQEIIIDGNYVYLLTNAYFYILDTSNPFNPTVLSKTYMFGYDFAMKDHYAFIAMNYTGLSVMDVSDPYNPLIVNHISTPLCWEIEIDGNYAYISSTYYFGILDITDPTADAEIVGFMPMGRLSDIEIQGDYAYLTEFHSSRSLLAVDISDPANPWIFSVSGNGTFLEDIEVVDNYLYAAGGLEGGFMSFKLWD